MATELEIAFAEIAEQITSPTTFVRAVLSGRRRNFELQTIRIDIKPVQVKGEVLLQIAANDGVRTTTKNVQFSEFQALPLLQSGYANFLVEHTTGSLSMRITKKGEALLHRETGERTQNLEHDRKKSRLLEGSDPFLIEVGISDSNGVVKPSRMDKFKQVEEFLRILAPTVESAISSGHLRTPSNESPLEIVDLGCGHAYLTFAAHQYLRSTDKPVHVVGIDVREESRARNEKISQALGIQSSIEFRAEAIAATTQGSVDVAIALHACDTATDDALAWAVQKGASVILAAPCCHHDIQSQMVESPEPWQFIARQGILKERLGDILTDGLRCQILRILGYRVDAIEFIGGEHTPRNLLIRAVKTGAQPDSVEIDRYRALIAQWKIAPRLSDLLSQELAAQIG